MSEKEFAPICKKLVCDYYGSLDPEDVYIVWMCKTLQNNKALLSTNQRDGMYFEITCNGDKGEIYFDAYRKVLNQAHYIGNVK